MLKSRAVQTVLLSFLTVTLGLGFLWLKPRDPRLLPATLVGQADGYSNILPHDYTGSQACAQCHPKQHHLWRQHPHSRMNQLPTEQTVQGDFHHGRLVLPQATVHFNRVKLKTESAGERQLPDDSQPAAAADRFQVEIVKHGQPWRSYEITRTVGSRTMQFYIARQLTGPEPADHAVYAEHMLPFAWSRKLARWLPKNYFDPDGPDLLADGVPQVEAVDHLHDVRPYARICMNCHNTYAYAYRLFQPELCGFPDATLSGAIDPLTEALSRHVQVRPTLSDYAALNARLNPDQHLVHLGIGCESCHFGGREHVEKQEPMRYVPTSPLVRLVTHHDDVALDGNPRQAATINGICIQCHSGQARLFPNGASTCNSREAVDLRQGRCASQMRCVDCHEPHSPQPPSGSPLQARHVAVCAQCHPKYQDAAVAQAHMGHPASSELNCLDCHMPRQVQGLDELIRTHRVSLPVEESMVAAGATNACNLCHLDRSVQWTLRETRRLWGRAPEAQQSWEKNYGGSLDRPVGRHWLTGQDTALRLVAAQAFARSPWGQELLPELIQALNDPEPINRVFALYAVERVAGDRLDARQVEITAPPAVRQQQIARLLEQWNELRSRPTQATAASQDHPESPFETTGAGPGSAFETANHSGP